MPEAPSRGRADRLYPVRLGPREREALEVVQGLPGLTIAGLARALDVEIGQARRIVERLERRGQLGRQPPARDAASRLAA